MGLKSQLTIQVFREGSLFLAYQGSRNLMVISQQEGAGGAEILVVTWSDARCPEALHTITNNHPRA